MADITESTISANFMRQIGERQTDINRSVSGQVLEEAKRTKALAVALRSGMESKCERSEPLTEYGFSNVRVAAGTCDTVHI